MDSEFDSNVIEAALLAAGRSLSAAELADLYEESARPSLEQVRQMVQALNQLNEGRSFEIAETASGFRMQIRRAFSSAVLRLWPERAPRYSRAMLETLSLIAYRQPLTRAEIESVRGVAVNPNIIKTLLERNWIRVLGHREVPGRPELLGTTREFLDYFGLKTLSQLPPLAELKLLEDINPQLQLPEPVGTLLEEPLTDETLETENLQGSAPAGDNSESAVTQADIPPSDVL